MGLISRTTQPDPVPAAALEPFARLPTAVALSTLNLKPTWGISSRRYDTTESGTGAAVTETGGEFKLSTGTATGNAAEIITLGRSQYLAGNAGRWGVGVRVATPPTGSQDFFWGLGDANNGYLMGVDATDPYVNRRTGGSDNKTHRDSWNLDKLDGTGPSGLIVSDLSTGFITQCDFFWYSYGPAIFYFLIFDSNRLQYIRVPIHIEFAGGGPAIVDPNQPLLFRAINGGSTSANGDLFIGGHQFETIGSNSLSPERPVTELLTNFTTAENADWQPLIAVRPTANFGPSGRTNSVRMQFRDFFVAADGEVETRLTIDGATSNLSWGTPTDWDSGETAAETKVTGSTALTTSATGLPLAYGFADGSNRSAGLVERDALQEMGADREAILWVRRISGSGTITIKHANLRWLEQH